MATAQQRQAAIAGIESGGNYGSVGPWTKGDRPYGKYQVMGNNIGPWTEQVLGYRMTPEEFLANPRAQDNVFNAIFGGYVDKYGEEGAAKAWHAGEAGMKNPNAHDRLGTYTSDYGASYLKNLSGGGGQYKLKAGKKPNRYAAASAPAGDVGGLGRGAIMAATQQGGEAPGSDQPPVGGGASPYTPPPIDGDKTKPKTWSESLADSLKAYGDSFGNIPGYRPIGIPGAEWMGAGGNMPSVYRQQLLPTNVGGGVGGGLGSGGDMRQLLAMLMQGGA